MNVNITTNADELNRAIGAWVRWSGKGVDEALAKQGNKLAYALRERLKQLSPAKGAVKAQRLDALANGFGVRVRKSARESVLGRNNMAQMIDTRKAVKAIRGRLLGSWNQKNKATGKVSRVNARNLMVEKELNLRSQGGGFLARGSMFANIKAYAGTKTTNATSMRGIPLSRWGVSFGKNPRFVHFEWSRFVRQAAKMTAGMTRPRAVAAAAMALRDVSWDIMVKVREWQDRAMAKVFR